ncbi:hypothetical protein WGT02_30000 (plasmid) [Rhizobium sp. T1470]|nr:hypothetical protein [Rhizobium sp. T1473]MCA0806138.1 hypothetical protein [Rhizobium sp. T1473]
MIALLPKKQLISKGILIQGQSRSILLPSTSRGGKADFGGVALFMKP